MVIRIGDLGLSLHLNYACDAAAISNRAIWGRLSLKSCLCWPILVHMFTFAAEPPIPNSYRHLVESIVYKFSFPD